MGQGSAKLKSRNNSSWGFLWMCLCPSHDCIRRQEGNAWMDISTPPVNCWLCEIKGFSPNSSSPVCLPQTYCCVFSVYKCVSARDDFCSEYAWQSYCQILGEAHDISVMSRLARQHLWDFSPSFPLSELGNCLHMNQMILLKRCNKALLCLVVPVHRCWGNEATSPGYGRGVSRLLQVVPLCWNTLYYVVNLREEQRWLQSHSRQFGPWNPVTLLGRPTPKSPAEKTSASFPASICLTALVLKKLLCACSSFKTIFLGWFWKLTCNLSSSYFCHCLKNPFV